LLGASFAAGQIGITGVQQTVVFKGTADSGVVNTLGPSAAYLSVVGGNLNTQVKYKLDHIDLSVSGVATTPADFLVVSPSAGTLSGAMYIPVAVRPDVFPLLGPGSYSANVYFTTVDQTPAFTALDSFAITLAIPPAPTITSILNTASLTKAISPGEMVSIFGANIGPFPVSSTYNSAGFFPTNLGPTNLGGTTVTFNGVAAPLLYASQGQINAVVPYEVAGQASAQVVVSHYGQRSPAFTISITDTSPSLFTATQTGTGQGAILNVDSTGNISYNSTDNPAVAGSLVELYATGAGVWNPSVPDGMVNIGPLNFATQPVSLTIGGKPATIYYAGAAGLQVSGLLQINAYVPNGIGSGSQPVILKIGATDNAAQNVTIAVK
jgi:uncharacterized protein (TIGR03437 family)